MLNLLTKEQKQGITQVVNNLSKILRIEKDVVKADIWYDEVMLSEKRDIENILTIVYYDKYGRTTGFALLRDIHILKGMGSSGSVSWVLCGKEYSEVGNCLIRLKRLLADTAKDKQGAMLILVDE